MWEVFTNVFVWVFLLFCMKCFLLGGWSSPTFGSSGFPSPICVACSLPGGEEEGCVCFRQAENQEFRVSSGQEMSQGPSGLILSSNG